MKKAKKGKNQNKKTMIPEPTPTFIDNSWPERGSPMGDDLTDWDMTLPVFDEAQKEEWLEVDKQLRGRPFG